MSKNISQNIAHFLANKPHGILDSPKKCVEIADQILDLVFPKEEEIEKLLNDNCIGDKEMRNIYAYVIRKWLKNREVK